MAKGSRGRRRLASRQCRPTPYPLRSCYQEISEKEVIQDKDWDDATCSVCMEYPHNAVLLLCSSHDKGCRPYMCDTSYRYSNCLDQYKKACAKLTELACPLCRGQVKGWTVVEPAREFLNAKKRGCIQDKCSFVGSYKELRKHMRVVHPLARPHEVDPTLEQKWRRMEHEREQNDVMSTIRSSMPGAVVVGDYVIEGDNYGSGFVLNGEVNTTTRDVLNFLFLLRDFEASGSVSLGARLRRLQHGNSHHSERTSNDDGVFVPGQEDGGASVVDGHRSGRVLLGRSGRRQRRRQTRVR